MKYFYIVLISIISASNVGAQAELAKYNNNGFYSFNDSFKLLNTQIFTTYKSQFGLTPDDSMAISDQTYLNEDQSNSYDFGTVLARYKQYYKGVEVEQKHMVLATKCSVVLTAYGSIVPGLSLSNTPAISSEQALNLALQEVPAQLGYAWQNTTFESNIKTVLVDSDLVVDSSRTFYPTGQLVIAKKYGAAYGDVTGNYALCWKFNITTLESVFRDSKTDQNDSIIYNSYDTVTNTKCVYVNAATGAIWASYDPSMGIGNNGRFYTGKVWTWHYGDKFDLETWKSTVSTTGYHLRDTKDIYGTWGNFTNIVYKGNNQFDCCTSDRDPATASWSLHKSWDYYANQQGVSHNNTIYLIAGTNRAYYPKWTPFGSNTVSTDWDKIEIGDAGPNGNLTMSDLDLMGHEFTHREIYRSSGLGVGNYYNTDGQVMNEAFCDIFGLLISNWQLGTTNWTIGNGYASGIYKRHFVDPENDIWPGTSLKGSVTNYNDMTKQYNYQPYSGGGFIRKWFNHLSQGAPNWNQPYTPIGMTTAGRVAFITMYWWMWAGSTFADLRNATLSVADIHFGGRCGQVYNAVEKAWADVGLGTTSPCNPLRLTHPKVVNLDWVDQGQVHFGVLPSGCNVCNTTILNCNWILPNDWVGVPTGNDGTALQLISVGGNPQSGTVRAVVSYIDSAGNVSSDTLSSVMHICTTCNDLASNNSKATSTNKYQVLADIKAYPNPTKGSLHIDLPATIKSAKYTLLGIAGNLIASGDISNAENTVALPDVPPGNYVLKVQSGSSVLVRKIVIN